MAGARQQIADRHPRIERLRDNYDVAGFRFCLHRLAAVERLPMRTDTQSSPEVIAMFVAPCSAARLNCASNSFLK
jgi:hypothetical protein